MLNVHNRNTEITWATFVAGLIISRKIHAFPRVPEFSSQKQMAEGTLCRTMMCLVIRGLRARSREISAPLAAFHRKRSKATLQMTQMPANWPEEHHLQRTPFAESSACSTGSWIFQGIKLYPPLSKSFMAAVILLKGGEWMGFSQ